MSGNAPETAVPPPEFDRLELAIRRLLDAHDGWRRRARAAEARVKELESALQEISTGRIDPISLSEEVERERQRNRELNERLAQARATVEKILTRIQFLEEGR